MNGVEFRGTKLESCRPVRLTIPSGVYFKQDLQLHKHGNRPIDNAKTAHFTLHISILQLHKL